MLSAAEFVEILPHARKRVSTFLAPVNEAMAEWEISLRLERMGAFLAQVGHESGQFLYMRELASGEAYDVGDLARRLGNTPEDDGDGERLKGRGPIQITGHDNYLACSLALFGDDRLLQFPELLEDPRIGCRAAGWFWHSRGLNDLADALNFKRITKLINGGYNHYAERVALYRVAAKVLGFSLEGANV